MRLRTRPRLVALMTPIALVSLTAAAVGCSDDGDAASDGSFAALLGELPAIVAEGNVMLQITYGDLDEATDSAALDRPSPDDAEAILDWISTLTGFRRDGEPATHAVQLSESFIPQSLGRVDEIREELGWSVADVEQYVAVTNLPRLFTVATTSGDISGDVEDAVGDPIEGVWSLGGDDLALDIADITAARPLGESLRMATKDGLLAASRTTPPVTAWLAGPTTSLGDNERLRSIAGVLDDAGAYTAMLYAGGDHSIIAALGASATPERVEQIRDQMAALPAVFTAVGVGLSLDDDGPSATLVYHFPTADVAEENAEEIEEMIERGTSLVTGRPVSDRLTLRDTTTQDNLVIATVGFADAPPGVIFSMLHQRDLPFVHG